MTYDFKQYEYQDGQGKTYCWEVIDDPKMLHGSIFGMFAGVSSCHFCGKTPSGDPSASRDLIFLVGQMFPADRIMMANGMCHKCEADFECLSSQEQLAKLEAGKGMKKLKFEVNLSTMRAREIKEEA